VREGSADRASSARECLADRDLLNLLHEIGLKEAKFRSIHDPWADTSTPHGRLMLTVLGGLAEFERSLIRARTSEGRWSSPLEVVRTEVWF
jgi:DNA invertase Pin-like site-specific DNA recombinase